MKISTRRDSLLYHKGIYENTLTELWVDHENSGFYEAFYLRAKIDRCQGVIDELQAKIAAITDEEDESERKRKQIMEDLWERALQRQHIAVTHAID